MKVVILLGTEHSIQLGKKYLEDFRVILTEECKKYAIKAISEEINQKSIASDLAIEHKLEYLIADPDKNERIRRNIPVDIELNLILEYKNQYPNIAIWPNQPSQDNLPSEVWEEYMRRNFNENRLREKVWIEKISTMKHGPILFICGTHHFNEFSRLLKASGFQVIESSKDWPFK